ncbi:MAG: BatD family protein [Phycisphaerales bacterium]
MYKSIVMMFIACVVSLSHAQTDEITLTAEISRARAYIGDVVTYQVVVRGADDGREPSVEFPGEIDSQYRGASSQSFTTMRTINGRQRATTDASYRHQYQLTVTQEGTITIPGAVVVVNGREYRSNSVEITALLPARSADDIIEVMLPSRDLYVGETVRAEVTWWIGADRTQLLNLDTTLFPSSFEVRASEPENPTGSENTLELFDDEFDGYVDQGEYQGRTMTRLRFDLLITATEVGSFEFGPLRAVFTRQDNLARGSRMYAESDTKVMKVVGVPTSGRPSGYRGLIGSYQVIADASNTKVNVGDPIEFRVLVSGNEPMIGLENTLNVQQLESVGFRVSPDGWREVNRRRGNERLFTTTIRATSDSVDQIPAIQLPAFNPETGEFVVYESKAIPLDVRAVRSVTLADAVTGQPSGNTDGARGFGRDQQIDDRDVLSRNPSALWVHPDADEIRGSTRPFTLTQVASTPAWIVILSGFGLLPAFSMAYVIIKRRTDGDSVVIARAWKQAKRLHARGDDVGAIRVYGGAVLGIDPDSLTGADLQGLGVSEELAQKSAAVLSEAEGMRYGTVNELRVDGSLLRAIRSDIRQHGLHNRAGSDGRRRRSQR